MTIIAAIARYLLGLMFLIFGLNDLFMFLPMGPTPPGPAGQFLGLLISTHYAWAVGVVMLMSAVTFLINRFVAFGLLLLGPVLVNILLFHLLMLPKGIVVGAIASLLWMLLAWRHRAAFAPLFQPLA
jgi:putative oxidoreductase